MSTRSGTTGVEFLSKKTIYSLGVEGRQKSLGLVIRVEDNCKKGSRANSCELCYDRRGLFDFSEKRVQKCFRRPLPLAVPWNSGGSGSEKYE